MRYQTYNLNIESQLHLPELSASDDKSPPDVSINIAHIPNDGLENGKQLGPFLWVNERSVWLKIPDVATFLISDSNKIMIDPKPGIDEESIRVFLLGSALGALLFQCGYLVLHGNAIRIGDQCMVCVGHSGAGKSTLAAGFMQRGFDILADDVVPVDSQCRAIAGFPRIKLWQDTATRLGIKTDNLQRIRPNLEKFNLPLTRQFGHESLPIRWVYILNSEHQDHISVEPILGMQRFQPIRNNTYRIQFLEAMSLKKEHLQLCGQLAGKIRLARVTRPSKGFKLDALIDHLLTDMKENP